MGMLSPYAEPFNLVTNNLSHEKDTMEIRNNQQNRKETEKQEEIIEHKDIVENYNKIQVLDTITNTTTISEQIKDEWIQVQKHVQVEK